MQDSSTVTRFIQRGRSTTAGRGSSTWTRELPTDLLLQASKRLQVLSLILAVSFVLANFLPAAIGGELDQLFSHPAGWLPGVASITVALIVFALARHADLSPMTKMNIGLLLGVAASYGIAMAQYIYLFAFDHVRPEHLPFIGLSWVAPWMVTVAIIVPNTPRNTLLAIIGCASAVPVVIGLSIRLGDSTLEMTPVHFFLGAIMPYLICGLMAHICSKIIYRLGIDVTRARELGSYELVELLGRGGMGEVWSAQHRMLARPAAIKLIRPEVLGSKDGDGARVALRRFEREAQATATMRSPHTIQLYDFGIAEDGTFYYVMELLDGYDTESLVQRFGPLEPERVIHFLRQICHSLGEAHENGLIHRDIKPANVYACRYGREVDVVKVLDFGLVKSSERETPEEVKLTAANVTGGTPAFMSPEQAIGDKPVDERTDIYAVGCVGYWLLTGQLVFEGDNPMQTIMHHVNTPPEPPSARCELPIPAALDTLILACLAKDPAERPASADELAARLDACAMTEAWSRERARHWWDAHRPAAQPPANERKAPSSS